MNYPFNRYRDHTRGYITFSLDLISPETDDLIERMLKNENGLIQSLGVGSLG